MTCEEEEDEEEWALHLHLHVRVDPRVLALLGLMSRSWTAWPPSILTLQTGSGWRGLAHMFGWEVKGSSQVIRRSLAGLSLDSRQYAHSLNEG